MKCLVTGGAGFIGSHIVDRLINDGHKVVVIDDLSTGNYDNLNEHVSDFHQKDITKLRRQTDFSMFKGVDVVFHLAAFPRVEPSIQEPVYSHDINVNGMLNVLEACRLNGVKRFVFTSSSAVYGEAKTPTKEEHPTNPMSPYGLHKLIGAHYCKLFSELYGL